MLFIKSMASVKKTNEAFDILKEYKGTNPYILKLYKQVYIDGYIDAIKDYQVEYILTNHNTEPKIIDKNVKIADWYGEKLQKDLELEFTPRLLKINSYLGETKTTYNCFVQYRKSVPPEMMFLPKNGIISDFLCEDYTKRIVDFERYNKLSESNGRKRILQPHQESGVKFLLSRKKCILADGMGLGKTTTLSVAAIEGNFDSVLIVCPASLKSNWRNELTCYVPEKNISIIESFTDKTKEELEEYLGYAKGKSGLKRNELLEEAKEKGQWKFNDFVIINYDILDKFFVSKRTYTKEQFDQVLDQSPLLKYIINRKSLIIIDEAHTLSNSKSNRFKVLRGLINKGNPDSIYMATGTPLTNNPQNLFCVLSLLNHPITQDWAFYLKRYCGAIEICENKKERDKFQNIFLKRIGKNSWYDLNSEQKKQLNDYLHQNCKYRLIPKDPTNLDELRERISHIYIRRIKDDMEGLPDKKTHKVVYYLTDKQMDEYERLWDEYEKEKKDEDSEKDLNKQLLEGMIYRQYLANQMVPKTEKLADSFIKNGEKVIIACCYDEELYALRDYYGDKCVIYNGKMSLKEKDKSIDEFTNNPNVCVFIGNIIAAGMGINLVVSHRLIFNSMSYVPSSNLQMQDRVHRIGQKERCDIYYQIFKGTYCEKMLDINSRKIGIIDTVIKKEEDK